MSVTLICAVLFWVEAHNSDQGGNRYRTGVYTAHLPLGERPWQRQVVIERSVCCVITGCRVIIQMSLVHWDEVDVLI